MGGDTNQIKNKKISFSTELFVLAIIIVFAISSFYIVKAIAEFRNIPDFYPRQITVSGEGKTYVVPDIAALGLSVVDEGDDVSAIVSKNTERTNMVIDIIKKIGVEEKDIKTTEYKLAPRYEWNQNTGKRLFRGYTVTQSISVKVRNFANIGEIISQTTELGSMQNVDFISDLQFAIENPEKARQEAREKAIEQAKEKAANIAKSSGLKLVKLLNIQEGYYPYYYGATYKEAMGGGESATFNIPAPEIQPGETEVSVSVMLIYRIR